MSMALVYYQHNNYYDSIIQLFQPYFFPCPSRLMFCVYCTHDMRVLHETSNKSPERVQNGSPTCLTRLAQTTVTAPGSVRVTHSRSRKSKKKSA